MHDIHLPPPRYGDHNSVNRHLTAGGTVEGIPRENPYREYYLSLHKKNMENYVDSRTDEERANEPEGELTTTDSDFVLYYPAGSRLAKIINDNPCGKPHNNGRDTCNECLTIKEGI